MKNFYLFIISLICLSIESGLKFDYQQLFNDSPASFPSEDGVMILTSDTIDEAIKIFPRLAILFFTPWCPHCKAIYPELCESTKSQEIKDMDLHFAKIDIDYYTEIKNDFNIKGIPSVILFSNGEKSIFSGVRKADTIIEWFYKRIVNISHPINSLEDIKKFENSKKHGFIYFGEDPERIKEYEKFALERDSYLFGLCKDKNLIKNYGKIKPESVVLYKPFDDPPYIQTQNLTTENLEEILKINMYPLIWDNGDKLLTHMFSYWKSGLFFLRNENDTIKTPEYDKHLRKMAEKYRGKVQFCAVDILSEVAQRIIKFSNITQANAETNEPSAVIYSFKKGFHTWILEKFFDKYSNENFEQFIKNYIDNKMVPPIKQEEVPKRQEGPVYKLVYSTFKKEVLENDLNVLVKFYSPTCPHCKKMENEYIKLAEKLKDNKNIRIAEYNIQKNEFDLFKIDGYPTLIMFKAGDKENRINYEGNRTIEDMMNFVLNNIGQSEKQENNQKKEDL